jgi:ribosome-binding factor A
MSRTRAERLAEVIKTEVSEIIQRDLKDPRIGFASITDVEVTADLRLARIYVSVLGDAAAKRRTMTGLERARGHVRSELGARLALRYMPEISFRLDESIEHGARVVSLIRKVAGEEPGESEDGHRPDPEE